MLRYYFFFCLFFVSLACNKPDLKLINSIKSFESQWADTHTKLTYIERNLADAAKRYPSHLSELEQYARGSGKGNAKDSSNTGSFHYQYKKMMLERDKMELSLKSYQNTFQEDVNDFNTWQQKVMKGNIAKEKAEKELEKRKKGYMNFDIKLDSLSAQVSRNIATHNKLTRDYAISIGNFNNYNMTAH